MRDWQDDDLFFWNLYYEEDEENEEEEERELWEWLEIVKWMLEESGK